MRTDEKLDALCDRLHYNCGDLHEAARFAGMSPAFVFQWIKEDTTAADKVREAQRVGYAGLESEAIRRAVVGDEKGVYFRGERVGSEYVKSDGLLTKLMEARIPEFRKGEGGPTYNAGQMQINIMPRADSYEDWLKMRDATLARRDAEVPAIEHVVEAEYEIVENSDRPLAALGGLL